MQYKAGQSFYAKHDNKPLVVTIVVTKGDLFGVLEGWDTKVKWLDEKQLQELVGEECK